MRIEVIVSGVCAFVGRIRFRRYALGILVIAVVTGFGVTALLAWPMDTARYLTVSASPEMEDQSGALLYAFTNDGEQWCFSRRLGELGPRIVQATLAAEDHRFYQHPGVDPMALARAMQQNLSRGKIVSGASTLTMQLVKQSQRSSRTLRGKVTQLAQALRLEWRCDKNEILCAYLNKAPYGLNLVGVEAASRRYFGKSASELSLGEAALLAGIPKAPNASEPLKNPARANQRRNYVLRRMRMAGFVDEAEYRRALDEPITAVWHEFPKLAPHLAMGVRTELRAHGRVRVTLDLAIQRRAEQIAERVASQYENEIGNAAIIVADVRSATVLARVGSSDFFSAKSNGQFDACRAGRSPGSALKPFTYGIAMDSNLLYASEMLLDDSLDFGTYGPANYDGTFTGVLSASDALKRSLNIPAVTVLARVGVPALYGLLRDAGITTLTRPADSYGLGLTLGNCEARLDELVAAYTMIADLGEYRPLRVLADADDSAPAKRCLSRGACLKLFDMLEQGLPGELPEGPVRIQNVRPRICWKTGTSTGHFDAWAFVFNSQYVVGVWLGNDKGKPSKRLVGIEAALPAAGELFRSLDSSTASAWPEPGEDLRVAKICAISGLPASPWCDRTQDVTFPRGQYLTRMCDVHRPLADSGGTGFASAVDGSKRTVVERLPGAAKGWDMARIASTPADTMSGAGGAEAAREELRILEPADQSEFVLTGEPNGDRVRVRSSLDTELQLHWYMDDTYLGSSSPSEPLAVGLAPGRHVLACMTSNGTRDKVAFNVVQPDSRVRFGRR